MKDYGRLITAMATPFDENLKVDYKKAIKLAKKLVDEGTTSLLVCGTTGEAPTLTSEEKSKLIKTIRDNVNVPIIAGVGTNSTRITIENSKIALDSGADGLLVVVPYYNKPNQDNLYNHFKTVAEKTNADIMLYNVPGRTGTNMLPETVARLAEIDNIFALKEASGNTAQLSEMVKRTPEDFLVYTGDDVLTLPSLAVGGYGVVSVAAHIVGKKMKEMIESYLRGDVKRAADINIELLDIFNGLFVTTNPIPLKAALKLTGFDVGGLRPPLYEASSSVVEKLEKIIKSLNLA